MSDIIDLEFNIVSCQSNPYVQASVTLLVGDSHKQIHDISRFIDLQFPKSVFEWHRTMPTFDIIESV